MQYRRRKYKLNSEDIAKVYRIAKKNLPPPPPFETIQKPIMETDDDYENLT